MTITIVWDDAEKTRLRYDISGAWTWQELHEAQATIFAMMDESPRARIGTIAHFTEGKVSIPPNTARDIQRLRFAAHPKAGLTVIVGASGAMKAAFRLLRTAYTMTGRSVEFAYANALEDARLLLKGQL
ncbi:MAG: hypothetical protein OHK0046_32710 [Anaerolineae bacterium]